MVRKLPPLNPLRAFEATARCGSVSAAAKEMQVTHGAISHQLRILEENLGVLLFDRKGNRLELTKQGAALLPSVSQAFTDIASATSQLQRPATSGVLNIGCAPALLSLWLIPRMHLFAEQYPDVTLSFNATNSLSGDMDVALLYGSGIWEDNWSRLLSHLSLFPVVSPTLINAIPLRSVQDIQKYNLLHSDKGEEWAVWLDEASIKLSQVKRNFYMNDARTALEAALNSQGIALGDTMTVKDLVRDGKLVIPFDQIVPSKSSFYVVCRTEKRSTALVKAFIDWVFEQR